MRTYKKETRQIYMSVEGRNCETFYFAHLAELINQSGRNTYNLKIKSMVESPMSYAKRLAHKPTETMNRSGIPYFHIQDVEDYENEVFRGKFYGIIDEMEKAKKTFHIGYELGYSNYAFDLWMLLHVAGNINYTVTDRHAYLKLINRHFHRKYSRMDEFKKEEEFKKILEEFVTLDSVFQAIENARRIESVNVESGNKQENYKNYKFYHDNPATSVHEVVQMIMELCGVSKN
ncbi:MAG: RloB family protein [Lachnospiraceae bacterium]|nr:RloB family protein [Lachnospiraceae bacterium]